MSDLSIRHLPPTTKPLPGGGGVIGAYAKEPSFIPGALGSLQKCPSFICGRDPTKGYTFPEGDTKAIVRWLYVQRLCTKLCLLAPEAITKAPTSSNNYDYSHVEPLLNDE